MLSDSQLLVRFARERNQGDFEELVNRHLALVYATAVRLLAGDVHTARDVSQQVFVELARKAGALSGYRVLGGWLYTTTRNVAVNHVRSESRRRKREQEAHAMNEAPQEPRSDWALIRPALDQALTALSPRDREAVILRFFENEEFRAIGSRMATSGDAARLRVERALEKMRSVLTRAGIASTTAVLAEVLASEGAVAAPAGLAASASAAATSAGSAGIATAAFVFMSTSKIPLAVALLLVLAGAVGIGVQARERVQLQADIQATSRLQMDATPQRREKSEASTPASPPPAELTALRQQAEALKHELAQIGPAPLATGMVPMNAWKNVGRTSPGNALETLLWTATGGDYKKLAAMIALGPTVKSQAETLFSKMPEDMKAQFGVTTPEEMVALVYSVATQMTGAQVVQADPQGPSFAPVGRLDDMTLMVQVQREDGTFQVEPMDFHQTADGWTWTLAHNNLNHLGVAWRAFMIRNASE